jgi:4-hydroxy-tetrahydrodipicolinate reductase
MPSTAPVRLLVHGSQGRMGARIAALAREDARFDLIAAHDREDSAQSDSLAVGLIDAIIDFTSDEGAQRAAELAQKHRAALLVGTTGLSAKTIEILGKSARYAPVMIAPNTSLGVAVMNHLIAEAARLVGADFHIDLIESHHIMKRDAPSGTALRLKQTLRDKLGIDLPDDRIHCLRAGDIIGEHTMQFSGPGEIIKISHTATNRDLFVRGALRAIAWLHGRTPGMYTVEQSLI